MHVSEEERLIYFDYMSTIGTKGEWRNEGEKALGISAFSLQRQMKRRVKKRKENVAMKAFARRLAMKTCDEDSCNEGICNEGKKKRELNGLGCDPFSLVTYFLIIKSSYPLFHTQPVSEVQTYEFERWIEGFREGIIRQSWGKVEVGGKGERQ